MGQEEEEYSMLNWDLTAGASLPICCLGLFSLGPISCYLFTGEEGVTDSALGTVTSGWRLFLQEEGRGSEIKWYNKIF